MGRDVLSAREMRDMNTAESIYNVYRSWDAAKRTEGGIAQWAEDSPDAADLLNSAMIAAREAE